MAEKEEEQPLKYKERLSQSQSEKESLDLQYQVEDAHLQLQGDIKETTRSLTKAKRTVEDLKGKFPLDSNAIASAIHEVDNLEGGLKILNDLDKELF